MTARWHDEGLLSLPFYFVGETWQISLDTKRAWAMKDERTHVYIRAMSFMGGSRIWRHLKIACQKEVLRALRMLRVREVVPGPLAREC